LRDGVRQFFANGQIHVPRIPKLPNETKSQGGESCSPIRIGRARQSPARRPGFMEDGAQGTDAPYQLPASVRFR
jgi:hypothetical protein